MTLVKKLSWGVFVLADVDRSGLSSEECVKILNIDIDAAVGRGFKWLAWV